MDGWQELTIETICDILDNKRIPINAIERDLIQGKYPYYGANGIQGYISKYIFDQNLILMAEDGGNFDDFAQRPIAFKVSGKCWVNNHAHVLSAKQGYDQDYIFYSLEHKDVRCYIKGGTRTKLNKSELIKIEVKIPSDKIEQQKIASILSTIDKNIEQTEQLIAKQKNIKTGLMHDLLSYGIDSKGQVRSPQTHKFLEKKGMVVPKDWECKPISEVIHIINGGTPSTTNPLFWNGDIYWLSVDDFNKGRRFVYKAQKTITSLGLKNSSTNILKKGEIIISARGTVGVIAQIGRDMAFNQSCYGISLKSEEIYSNDYLYYFLCFYFKENNIITAGSTFDTIKKSTFDEIFISFSKNKEEQKKIISLLSKQDLLITEQETKLEKLKSIKKGLMEDLLTGKVRVNY